MVLIPVILSGGAGTRLWPVSREGHPKPFMKLADGESLLMKTYARACRLASAGEVLTVTNRDYYFMCGDEFAKADPEGHHQASFILEPFGRNTAPAIALAALHVVEHYGTDACMLVLAADHLIQDPQVFADAVASARHLAANNYLVTFGIVPDAPDTGFGYIEAGEHIGCGHTVKRFVEKPDTETAITYLSAGNYFWNSGMFCFKAGHVLEELSLHAPDVLHSATQCWEAMQPQGRHNARMMEIPSAHFETVPGISIDYALMERSSNIAVVPGAFGWSDIGSWSAISKLVLPDKHHNRSLGDAVIIDSHNLFIESEDRLVAAVGVDNLMIIDTADALLIAHPDKTQDVKKVVAYLKESGHEACRQHRTVLRPWGTYTILEEGPQFKIKRIEVKPGASLSLQMHQHRSEHWVVVSGKANVVNGEQELSINTNESTYIPAGHKHRLENPGTEALVIIEVQSGSYLGEDDIVRFEDIYGRN